MHRQHPPTRSTVTLGVWLAGLLALVGAVIAPTTAFAAAPAPSPQAEEALSWLGEQLAANGGVAPSPVGVGTDWGLTMDMVLAYVAAGDATAPAAVAATDILSEPANVAFYTGDATVAGATAKTLLTLLSMGRSTTIDGTDLEASLRSLMQTTGVQQGRFSDVVADPTFDASNGFGQSLAILALAMTDGGVPADAVAFLIAQQCPGGGFRLMYGTTAGCTSDANGDTDTTALSLQALMAVERTPAVLDALETGIAWLLGRQEADGSWGTPPWGGPNSNTTGLIAQLLRAAGYVEQAARGEAWIETVQLTPLNAAGTPAAGDEGAIAYNRSGFNGALTDGISSQVGDQWRRATSQAVLGLGLAPYGVQDVDPLVTTTTTSTTSSTTTTEPTTTSTLPATTAPTTSVVGSTTTVAAGSVAGLDTDNRSPGQGGGSTRSTAAAGTLARTGADSGRLAVTGAALLMVGAVLTGSQMRRRSGTTAADRGAR